MKKDITSILESIKIAGDVKFLSSLSEEEFEIESNKINDNYNQVMDKLKEYRAKKRKAHKALGRLGISTMNLPKKVTDLQIKLMETKKELKNDKRTI